MPRPFDQDSKFVARDITHHAQVGQYASRPKHGNLIQPGFDRASAALACYLTSFVPDGLLPTSQAFAPGSV